MLCFVLIREVMDSGRFMESGSSISCNGVAISSTPSPSSSPSPTEDQVHQSTNPKKPLLKFETKITKNKKKNSGGCEEWMCTLCNHVFKGSYTRVWHHLLSLPCEGVKGCTCSLEKRMELTKLHRGSLISNESNLDNDRTFKVPRVSSHDVEVSVNQRLVNQVDSEGGTSLGKIKRSSSVANEQIRKIYNVVHGDEADDAIADFFYGKWNFI